MKTLFVLLSLSAFTYGAAIGIGDILPTRLMANQCRDVCKCGRINYCPAPGAQYELKDCVTGTSKMDCCSYCSY